MADAVVYYCVYSDENYGLQVQREKIVQDIPAGTVIQTKVLEELPYLPDVRGAVMAETYEYVVINGTEFRVDPDDRTKAYHYEFVIDPVTGAPMRSKKCWYHEPTKSWVRYVHQSTKRTKEEYEAIKDTYVLPVSWTPEQYNTLPESYKLLIEYGPNDVTWCEVNDSRDQNTIGDNPVV